MINQQIVAINNPEKDSGAHPNIWHLNESEEMLLSSGNKIITSGTARISPGIANSSPNSSPPNPFAGSAIINNKSPITGIKKTTKKGIQNFLPLINSDI